MTYIVSDGSGEGCIFCPGEDRVKDEERLIVHVGPLTMVMMNRYPYNNGHLLVAPVRHVADLASLSAEEMLDLMRMTRTAVAALTEEMHPDGFNAGLNLGRVAGAGVEAHLHFHIVPRWAGDTNFMTVLGDVRVIPEHIRETYRKLRVRFKNLVKDTGGTR